MLLVPRNFARACRKATNSWYDTYMLWYKAHVHVQYDASYQFRYGPRQSARCLNGKISTGGSGAIGGQSKRTVASLCVSVCVSSKVCVLYGAVISFCSERVCLWLMCLAAPPPWSRLRSPVPYRSLKRPLVLKLPETSQGRKHKIKGLHQKKKRARVADV